jgi:hypothetical protein
MNHLVNGAKLLGACFLTAAFVYMFLSMKDHLFVDAFLKGYSECLMEVPGGQPDDNLAKQTHTDYL